MNEFRLFGILLESIYFSLITELYREIFFKVYAFAFKKAEFIGRSTYRNEDIFELVCGCTSEIQSSNKLDDGLYSANGNIIAELVQKLKPGTFQVVKSTNKWHQDHKNAE